MKAGVSVERKSTVSFARWAGALSCWKIGLKYSEMSRMSGSSSSFRMIVSMNVSHIVRIRQVLTILHQLICRGVANFGTRCILRTLSSRSRQWRSDSGCHAVRYCYVWCHPSTSSPHLGVLWCILCPLFFFSLVYFSFLVYLACIDFLVNVTIGLLALLSHRAFLAACLLCFLCVVIVWLYSGK